MKCYACDNEATRAATNVVMWALPGEKYWRGNATGDLKTGCDDHPISSRIVYWDGNHRPPRLIRIEERLT